MLVDFNTIADQSRIWIYAAEYKLTNDQENYILDHISIHLQNWEAHKVPLTAGVTILESHFIIVVLDALDLVHFYHSRLLAKRVRRNLLENLISTSLF